MSAASESVPQIVKRVCPAHSNGIGQTIALARQIAAVEAERDALRAQLSRMACPVCGTVNPPEVHTCTPRPTVTVVLNEWAVVNKNNWIVERIRGGDGSSNNEYRERYDSAIPYDAPHTVKRVALIDEPTTMEEG